MVPPSICALRSASCFWLCCLSMSTYVVPSLDPLRSAVSQAQAPKTNPLIKGDHPTSQMSLIPMPDHGMDLSMDLGESLQYLTTCITKVLRFPRARCTIFFLLLSLLYLSTFYAGKPFIWLKSTTILVQLTFYLEFETFLRYFLRL